MLPTKISALGKQLSLVVACFYLIEAGGTHLSATASEVDKISRPVAPRESLKDRIQQLEIETTRVEGLCNIIIRQTVDSEKLFESLSEANKQLRYNCDQIKAIGGPLELAGNYRIETEAGLNSIKSTNGTNVTISDRLKQLRDQATECERRLESASGKIENVIKLLSDVREDFVKALPLIGADEAGSSAKLRLTKGILNPPDPKSKPSLEPTAMNRRSIPREVRTLPENVAPANSSKKSQVYTASNVAPDVTNFIQLHIQTEADRNLDSVIADYAPRVEIEEGRKVPVSSLRETKKVAYYRWPQAQVEMINFTEPVEISADTWEVQAQFKLRLFNTAGAEQISANRVTFTVLGSSGVYKIFGEKTSGTER